MTRPPRPTTIVPAGCTWMIGLADDCQALPPDDPRKCTQSRIPPHHHNPCNAAAVALIEGRPRCGNHLEGRWVTGRVVLRWELGTEGES